MKDVLLINPRGMQPAVPPVGLEYVASSLKKTRFRPTLLDLNLAQDEHDALAGAFARKRYDAVGITVRNIDDILSHVQEFFLPRIRELVGRVRQLTAAPVILGGAGFSIEPEAILAFVGADYGVAGCGIPAFHSLLERLERNEALPGEIFRQEPRPYLDEVFDRDWVDLKAYTDNGVAVGVNTTSGCTQRCIYCTYPRINAYTLQLRSPQKVLGEIEHLVEQGITDVFFADSVFNIDNDHAQTICDAIAARKLPVSWRSFLNPQERCLPEGLLDAMVASGMASAQLGVDSGSERMLRAFRKSFGTKDLARATALCQEKGLKVSYSVLFGAPGETKETIDETFALIDALRPDYVDVEYGVRIYAGTQLAELAVAQGVIPEGESLCEPIFYPFSLGDYVREQTDKRESCKLCFTERPVYQAVEEAESA